MPNFKLKANLSSAEEPALDLPAPDQAEKFLPPSENPEEIKPAIEQDQANPENEIEIATVKDFLKSLEWSYNIAEDPEIKQKIGHQIVNIRIGLNKTGCLAEDINVEAMPQDVLGTFNTDNKEIALDSDMLADFNSSSQLIAHVLDHEKKHKEGFADEGVAEKVVGKHLADTLSFYVNEQRHLESTFNKTGVNKALELYNIKKPEELIDCYLQVELEKDLASNHTELGSLRRPAYLKIKAGKETERLENKLKEGVPRLYRKMQETLGGGCTKKKITEILKMISQQEKK